MSPVRIITSVVVFAVSTLAPLSALAQGVDAGAGRRPFRGLFAADAAAPGDRSSVTLLISAFGEYNSLQGDASALETSDHGGIDPGIQASVTYRRPSRRLQFAWAADASARRDAVATGPFTGETMMTLSARLTRRASLQFAQRLAYVPQALFGAVPRFDDISGGIDQIAVMPLQRVMFEPVAQADSTAGFTYAFSEASSLSLEYGHHRAMNLENGSLVSVGNRMAARFTRRIRRNISARFGYGVHVSESDAAGTRRQVRTDDLDIGVDYGRTISLTRRTRFTFVTGTAIVGSDGGLADAARTGSQLRVTGAAALVREFGRTWSTRLSYDRGVQLSDRIAALALTDTVGLTANGSFGRRVAAAASTAFMTAQLRSGAEGDSYQSLTALAQMQLALTRRWALLFDYSHYAYRIGPAAQPPSDFARASSDRLPSTRNNSSVRAALTWRVPVLR